jgi:hypothetical protein
MDSLFAAEFSSKLDAWQDCQPLSGKRLEFSYPRDIDYVMIRDGYDVESYGTKALYDFLVRNSFVRIVER